MVRFQNVLHSSPALLRVWVRLSQGVGARYSHVGAAMYRHVGIAMYSHTGMCKAMSKDLGVKYSRPGA